MFTQIGKRACPAPAAACLVIVYRYFLQNTDKEWVHAGKLLGGMKIPAAMKNTGEFSRLAHWGLIEYMPRTPETKSRTTGIVKLTALGWEFAGNIVRVPTHLYFCNKRIVDRSSQTFTVQEALHGDDFDYNRLMNSTL